MQREDELLGLYEEWKRLTEAEGTGIEHEAWTDVRQCQTAKQALQARIIQASQPLQSGAGTPSAAFPEAMITRIRQCIRELIELEQRNNIVLGEKMAVLEKEIGSLTQTSKRLRNVHKSYVPAPGSVWNEYS